MIIYKVYSLVLFVQLRLDKDCVVVRRHFASLTGGFAKPFADFGNVSAAWYG